MLRLVTAIYSGTMLAVPGLIWGSGFQWPSLNSYNEPRASDSSRGWVVASQGSPHHTCLARDRRTRPTNSHGGRSESGPLVSILQTQSIYHSAGCHVATPFYHVEIDLIATEAPTLDSTDTERTSFQLYTCAVPTLNLV